MTATHTPDVSLGNLLIRRAQLTPKRRALTFENKTLTFDQLSDRVRRLAADLRANGVCRGDRVGYIGFNHPIFLEALFAASSLGAIFVPLNFRLSGPEIRYIANDAGIHTLIVDNEMQPVIEQELSNLCCQRYLAAEADAKPPEGWDLAEASMMEREPLPSIESVGADEVALIMYTSGTTGLPKGAMLTHGNFFWNTLNSCFSEELMGQATLTCAPLFHIGGLNVTTLQSLAKGVEVILLRHFDAGQVLDNIERHKVASMFGAPTMFLMMSQHAAFEKTDLSSVRALICGGAPVPVPLIELYGKRGVQFNQGYGLTETAPFASLLTGDMAMEKVGSAGTAPLFTFVRIVDKDNKALDPSEIGEVCIQGPNVMKGYWNRPEATSEAIDQEGWFHSGDMGYLDVDGYLFLCDRLKDMVISGGENVYPAEVESVLYAHPSIKEVAVIGLADEKWGEAVTAVVVLEQGEALTLEDLRDFAEENLARYKLPSQLRFIDLLPRNPAGKVLKYQLKESFA
ncbi:MAG: acyl-CoA synthetase [Cellvibrionaceae bacterium]